VKQPYAFGLRKTKIIKSVLSGNSHPSPNAISSPWKWPKNNLQLFYIGIFEAELLDDDCALHPWMSCPVPGKIARKTVRIKRHRPGLLADPETLVSSNLKILYTYHIYSHLL